MLHAVILAGGSGTRFGPASRAANPKQLLALAGERTMLQATVDRLAGLVPPDRITVATSQALAGAVAAQLPELPPGAVLAEPCKRDTAACIGLAAMAIRRRDPDATMLVTPSDHVISPAEEFRRAVSGAAAMLAEHPGRLVTFGVRPTYPAESFGYIERGEVLSNPPGGQGLRAFGVRRFKEKPTADVAAGYVAAGTFYWNAGIFVWKAQTILGELAQHAPETYARLARIDAAQDSDGYGEVLAEEFAAIRGVSIDYAVMEHAADVAVIEAPFAWDDLGSWKSLARLRGTDKDGNTAVGRHLGIRTTGTIVRTTDDHLVVTLGIDDCVIVHTADATLVAKKHEEEMIRQVVEQLATRGWKDVL